MESSDEFAWTDASQDSVKMKGNSDDDSESGYSYKKKLQKELFNHSQEVSCERTNGNKKSKKRKHSDLESSNVEEPKPKHIKTEPESDLDVKLKKKKSKTSICESDLHDEEFLNLKVKEEQMTTERKSPKLKKKKKKHRKNTDSADCSSFSESQSQVIDNSQCENDTDVNLELSIDNYSNLKEEPVDNENCKITKKKSKKKKEKEIVEDTIIEDKFSADETIVEQRVPNVHESESIIEEKSKKVKINSKSTDDSEDDALNVTKQSFIENLENNISNIDKSQLNRRKNTNETSTLFDGDVAPTDEILSANGSINTCKPVRKITDRIRFEDDTLDLSIDEVEVKGVGHSASLKKFLKRNAHLNQITVNQNSESVITDEDEVWVLKCPSEVDVKNLKDTSLVLDNKCKLKAESQTYIGFIENYIDQMSILTLNQNVPVIKNIPLSGIIQFSKRIPKPHYVEDNNIVNNQTNFIPLPDTKSRHPLFGVNYKSAIKIPKHISKRLNGVASEIITEDNEKRKKKKKKHKKEVNLSEEEQEMKPEPEPEPVIVHKKRKRKHSHNNETGLKLAKRLKHDPDSAEAWESEKAIEEQLFNF